MKRAGHGGRLLGISNRVEKGDMETTLAAWRSKGAAGDSVLQPYERPWILLFFSFSFAEACN